MQQDKDNSQKWESNQERLSVWPLEFLYEKQPLQHIVLFSRGRSRSQTGYCPSQEASTEKLELDVRKNKALDLLDKDFSVSFSEPDSRNYVAFPRSFYSICHSFPMENFQSTNNWFICHLIGGIVLIRKLVRFVSFFLEYWNSWIIYDDDKSEWP